MRVKMNVSIAGHAMPQYGLGDFSFATGQVVDLDERLATLWTKCGHCTRIDQPGVAETAAFGSEETAVHERPLRKRRE